MAQADLKLTVLTSDLGFYLLNASCTGVCHEHFLLDDAGTEPRALCMLDKHFPIYIISPDASFQMTCECLTNELRAVTLSSLLLGGQTDDGSPAFLSLCSFPKPIKAS